MKLAYVIEIQKLPGDQCMERQRLVQGDGFLGPSIQIETRSTDWALTWLGNRNIEVDYAFRKRIEALKPGEVHILEYKY